MALVFPRKKHVKHLNSSNLACNLQIRADYNSGVCKLLDDVPIDADADKEMNNIFSVLKTAAEEHVGFVPKNASFITALIPKLYLFQNKDRN